MPLCIRLNVIIWLYNLEAEMIKNPVYHSLYISKLYGYYHIHVASKLQFFERRLIKFHILRKKSFPLRIWSHLPKKCLMESFIFCGVTSMEDSLHKIR